MGGCQTAHNFNPLPPHGGRRNGMRRNKKHLKFQSTPSAWRETIPVWHTSRGIDISIHSLRMEGDFAAYCDILNYFDISIHSLRMEGDNLKSNSVVNLPYFNPLPPHGGRLCCAKTRPTRRPFQSTPSAWRETR